MSDVQKPVNIQYAVTFLDHIEDKNDRDQPVKTKPILENAIAQYEKDELSILADVATSQEVKQNLLVSTQGIYAYHIRNYGPEYYGPEAKNNKLAAVFTEALIPKLRDQTEPSEQELKMRQDLVKNHPQLKGALERFNAIEAHLSRGDGLNDEDVVILKSAISNIGNQIRSNVFESKQKQNEESIRSEIAREM